MKTHTFLSLAFLYVLFSCRNQDFGASSCMENPGQDKLLIFVGEKIDVTEMEQDISEDSFALPYAKFKAKYKIIEKVCGDYSRNTIEFIVYDHYGRPQFENYKTVLLYVSMYKDTFYHERYLYDALYKTKDGQWASPYSSMSYDLADSTKNRIKPHKMEFLNEVSFDVKGRSRRSLEEFFPSPYYKVENKKAKALYGNYVAELVQLKKEGVLKARGYYGNPDSTNKVKIQDVTLTDIKQQEVIQYKENEVVDTFYKFFEAVKRVDAERIRKMSRPNVICSVCEEPPRFDYENNFETIDSFIISAFRFFHFSQLGQEIENRTYVVSAEKRDTTYDTHTKSNEIIIYKISFTTYSDIESNTVKQAHDFEFIKINGKLLFYGMSTNIESYSSVGDRIRRSERYFKKSN